MLGITKHYFTDFNIILQRDTPLKWLNVFLLSCASNWKLEGANRRGGGLVQTWIPPPLQILYVDITLYEYVKDYQTLCLQISIDTHL